MSLTSAPQGSSQSQDKVSGNKEKAGAKESSQVGALPMATIQDDDERLLARIGYKQELRREFSKWSTVSYAISILGVLGSVPATFGPPLAAGGPATAVWCWFIGSFMAMCIASSVAELVSAYPTAGGMYFVTKHVVPQNQVAIFSWIQGWCNLLGQTAGVSSVAYTVSQMLLACASMNSDFKDGTYSYMP
ncbi:polyamine transporter tpo5 [Emydomyces testavorans]|uniref:Polyamine transporter tpo5 n=1 Tax=Emydomyces testavorans TaxID=2070801 RepID=A0AAF0DLI0_9EURO|nr:polyamine transporter tpo5 [Emydomyces testavorans]